MSQVHKVHDATGRVIQVDNDIVMMQISTSAPTDGTGAPGYGIGCLWINKSGTPAGILYVNIGTVASPNWLNIC